MSTLLWLLTEAGLVLCWLVTPWAPAPWLALCWLMAPLAGWLALLLTRKRSQVRLTCPVTAEKGKPFSVTAEVRQGVPFGRGRLTVSVENTVTGETHREKLTLHQGRGTWQVQSTCCGCLVMQAAELVLWDLLGVLPVRIPCTVQGRICVMPDTFPIEADPVSAVSRQTDCEEYAPDVRGSDPTEIFQIREYVPGDSLRQIHWKLSAKAGRYMVRDAAKPVDHRLTIYVERRTAPPRLADGLMEAAVSLCQAYVDQPFRLMWSAVEVRNQADQMVYQAEKTLSEVGDKVPESEKAPIQAGIDKLKETLKGEDTDAIKAATEELTQAFYKMSEKLYQQQAPQGDAAAQQPGGDTGAQGGQYYDADYKVVDDDDQNK